MLKVPPGSKFHSVLLYDQLFFELQAIFRQLQQITPNYIEH